MSDVVPRGPGYGPLSRRRFLELAALAVPAGALLAACSSGSSTVGGGSTSGFPIGAAARSSQKPVPVTLWHSMSSQNLVTLTHLTDQFNASQSDVKVSLVAQAGYPATLSAYTAALSGGQLPDLVQITTVDLELMIDSQSIVPAQAAVDADHYDLSDFLPSTLAYFRNAGGLQAMPFNISTQVLYFDNGAFTRAKLDPSSPPATLDDVRSASQQIVSSGAEKYGMSLKLTASNVEQWMAIGDATLLNNGNGRTSRATSVEFGDALGTTIFDWFGGMISQKLAQATSGTTFDNLLAIPSKIAPMTIDTSAALGTIASLLSRNQFPGVSLGVGPMPGPTAPGGGVVVGGAGLFLVNASPDERKDAAWQFTKFLLEPSSQATWAAGTGYVPVRQSAVGMPVLARAWSAVPGYRVAYEQVRQSPADVATAGGLSGAFADVETAIVNGLTAMANGTSPATALQQTVQASNEAISSYNARVP
jgi:sn-glycerol 3-phosphate transport system substrate-binding protein